MATPADTARALSLSRPLREVTCAVCGEVFQARDSRAKTCSSKCRSRLSRQSRRPAAPKKRGRPRKESQR